jgi:Nucleotidyl transferase AbiEii toxin, Type IV TA system
MNGNEAVLMAIEALEDCGVPYILVGSYSTNAYGIPRSTQDADFVIELGDTSITELARRLNPSIRIDPQMSFETATMTRRYVAEVVGTAFKIEFFLLSDEPHGRERFRRRQLVSALGRQVWLPTPEDVIVTKLHWALLANRSKDRDDARDVIAVQGDKIDWGYVHRWCEQHGTRGLLDEIRASIPPI